MIERAMLYHHRGSENMLPLSLVPAIVFVIGTDNTHTFFFSNTHTLDNRCPPPPPTKKPTKATGMDLVVVVPAEALLFARENAGGVDERDVAQNGRGHLGGLKFSQKVVAEGRHAPKGLVGLVLCCVD